jgi:hypothetical protein
VEFRFTDSLSGDAMPLNPLGPVNDYQSMLNRIFWFTTASALAATWMLRLYIPGLDAALGKIDFAVALADGKLLATPGGYLLPALGVGIFSRVFRLHARVSDWLGIRECFDVEVIIGELADRLGIDLALVGKEKLRRSRRDIMRRTFYPYVGGPAPQIDRQLVEQALDAWSWFWVGLEATLVFTMAGFGLLAGGAYQVGFQTLWGALAAAVFALPAIRGQCRRYAAAQVRAILDDPARAAIARAALGELTGASIHGRLAA